ncbi:MAG: histidine kinase dimerization/phospho-acceptor domain-containing protein [Nibricoccus sp.]
MKRWSLVSGLTIILLLLLVLCGFCVWTARTLTSEVDQVLSSDFTAIRTLRNIRGSVSTVDAQYRSSTSVDDVYRSRDLFDHEHAAVQKAFAEAQLIFGGRDELNPLMTKLDALLKDYFSSYEVYFSLTAAESDRFKMLTRNLAQSSADITTTLNDIANITDNSILARRAIAMYRGRRVVIVALAIAILSLGLYIWTSVRLTHAVFEPLRHLRDSIVKVGQRQFDLIVPLKGGDELAQIAETFNKMAAELRAYVAESDHRVIEANRISRAILEALPYPIYIVDDTFKVKLKNPRAAELNDALGISGEIPTAVRKCIDNAAATGRELIGDDLAYAVELADPDGSPSGSLTYLPQIFRMAAAGGGTSGWAVLLMDVTKMRQFDQAKTKAISTLGHEVKTPITSIRMTLHLLLEEKIGPLTADQRELVSAGRDDCERLLTVLHALLELARFEGRSVEMRLKPTEPAALLMEAEATHGGYLRGSAAPFAVEAGPPGLPLVEADAIHVVRVLGNYLSNAAKYRTPGTPVTMKAAPRADGFVRFSVHNHTARPLTEAEQAHVFDPFYRRKGEGAEGTGLGLTICREIAIAHGGRAGVWSEGDQVEFYIDLRQSKVTAEVVAAT